MAEIMARAYKENETYAIRGTKMSNSNVNKKGIEGLSFEVLREIFKHLDAVTLKRVSLVCKTFFDVTKDLTEKWIYNDENPEVPLRNYVNVRINYHYYWKKYYNFRYLRNTECVYIKGEKDIFGKTKIWCKKLANILAKTKKIREIVFEDIIVNGNFDPTMLRKLTKIRVENSVSDYFIFKIVFFIRCDWSGCQNEWFTH
jgi:hypothetical protein